MRTGACARCGEPESGCHPLSDDGVCFACADREEARHALREALDVDAMADTVPPEAT